MQFLVHAFHQEWFDEHLIAIDRALFGVDPTVWVEQFASYWLTELLQLAYVSYFLLPFIVGATLWVKRRRDEFDRFMLASAVAYVTCYIVFVAFPIEGPFHTLRHLQQVELSGGPVNAAVEWIERYGRVHGGAFPSAHMAGSVVALLAAWRVVPRLGRALLPGRHGDRGGDDLRPLPLRRGRRRRRRRRDDGRDSGLAAAELRPVVSRRGHVVSAGSAL